MGAEFVLIHEDCSQNLQKRSSGQVQERPKLFKQISSSCKLGARKGKIYGCCVLVSSYRMKPLLLARFSVIHPESSLSQWQ